MHNVFKGTIVILFGISLILLRDIIYNSVINDQRYKIQSKMWDQFGFPKFPILNKHSKSLFKIFILAASVCIIYVGIMMLLGKGGY